MAARYEYKVIELREKLFGGKLSADSLERSRMTTRLKVGN